MSSLEDMRLEHEYILSGKHQYSFSGPGYRKDWKSEKIAGLTVYRKYIQWEDKLKHKHISKSAEATEVSLEIDNPRYHIDDKICIVENLNFYEKILCKYMNIIFLFLFCLTIHFMYTWISSMDYTEESSISTGVLLTYWGGSILSIIAGIYIGIKFSGINKIYKTFRKQSMESLGFENAFDAFSQDTIGARMIINPAFMDKLEQFTNKRNLGGKIRIIWENDTCTLLLKGDIERYGMESDGSFTLIKSMEEILNLRYFSLNTNNQ